MKEIVGIRFNYATFYVWVLNKLFQRTKADSHCEEIGEIAPPRGSNKPRMIWNKV